MEFPFKKVVSSEEETNNLAAEFSQMLRPGDLVLLNGELGSGKTFFIKSVCRNFGIENSSSPSFSIVNEYSSDPKIIHFDFYRIKKIEELYDIGFEDYLLDGGSIVFIEWAEMFPGILPEKFFNIRFKFTDLDSREISITKHG